MLPGMGEACSLQLQLEQVFQCQCYPAEIEKAHPLQLLILVVGHLISAGRLECCVNFSFLFLIFKACDYSAPPAGTLGGPERAGGGYDGGSPAPRPHSCPGVMA